MNDDDFAYQIHRLDQRYKTLTGHDAYLSLYRDKDKGTARVVFADGLVIESLPEAHTYLTKLVEASEGSGGAAVRPLTADERRGRRKGDLEDVVKDQRLCVIGRGTDNFIHRHVTVTSVTKLYVNSDYVSRGSVYTNRHRRDNGRSTPMSDYGGTTAHLTCQRPEDKLRRLDLSKKPS